MPKEFSSKKLISMFEDGDIDSSMVLILTNEGERIYLHQFESDVVALEYLELMVASFRGDLFEKILMRSMN